MIILAEAFSPRPGDAFDEPSPTGTEYKVEVISNTGSHIFKQPCVDVAAVKRTINAINRKQNGGDLRGRIAVLRWQFPPSGQVMLGGNRPAWYELLPREVANLW